MIPQHDFAMRWNLDADGSLWIIAPGNIHILNNDSIELAGVRFLGCALWTDFRLNGEGEAWFARQRAKRLIEDFASIQKGGRRFTPEH